MTTSLSSASATGLPTDRRAFLAHTGLASLVAASSAAYALPALATEAGEIETMYAAHLHLKATFDAALEIASAAEERYEEPARPRWHPAHDEGGYRIIETSPRRGYAALDDRPENLARLRDTIAREFEPDAEDSGCPNRICARRARRTLEKIEVWKAEVQRRKKAAGLADAELAESRAGAAVREHRDAMLAIEASSYREVAFQSAVLSFSWDQMPAARVIARLVELAGISSPSMEA